MDKFTVTLTKQKETKGTIVYANADEGLSIYVPKEKIGSRVPAKLLVTFDPQESSPSSTAPEPEM